METQRTSRPLWAHTTAIIIDGLDISGFTAGMLLDIAHVADKVVALEAENAVLRHKLHEGGLD